MIVMERRYALCDEQWERLEALGLPGQSGHVGVTAKDNRRFVEAVLYRLRAGIPWRDLPPHFGNWHRVYVRFNRWSKQGVWHKVFEQLAKEPNNEYALIDSTIVRAHRSAAGARKKGQMPVIPKNASVLAGAGAD
jgi:transposase